MITRASISTCSRERRLEGSPASPSWRADGAHPNPSPPLPLPHFPSVPRSRDTPTSTRLHPPRPPPQVPPDASAAQIKQVGGARLGLGLGLGLARRSSRWAGRGGTRHAAGDPSPDARWEAGGGRGRGGGRLTPTGTRSSQLTRVETEAGGGRGLDQGRHHWAHGIAPASQRSQRWSVTLSTSILVVS